MQKYVNYPPPTHALTFINKQDNFCSETKVLSVIIPFYNVEQYIGECLKSVYNQDIPEDNYEVICVNDCSEDNSRAIVLEFQKAHSNLILIEHQRNTMQGGARNTGLRAARGKYVWFIDSDDYIKENCFGKLLEIVERQSLDFVLFDFNNVDEGGKFVSQNRFNFTPELSSGVALLKNIEENWESFCYVWARIVSRDFLLKNNLFFIENFHNEDFLNGILCFIQAERVLYLPENIVFYRKRPNSDMALRHKNQGVVFASRYKVAAELMQAASAFTDVQKREMLVNFAKWWAMTYYFKAFYKVIAHLSRQEQQRFFEKIGTIDNLQSAFPLISPFRRWLFRKPKMMAILHTVVRVPFKIKKITTASS